MATFFAYPDPFIWWQVLLYQVVVALGSFIIGCFGLGGGLLFLPAMLLLPSFEPLVAVPTVFVMACVANTARTIQLYRLGFISFRENWPVMVGAFIGGALGQLLLLYIPAAVAALLVAAVAVMGGFQVQVWVCKQWAKAKAAKAEAEAARVEETVADEAGNDPPDDAVADEATPTQVEPKVQELAEQKSAAGSSVKSTHFRQLLMVLVALVAASLSSVGGLGGPVIFMPLWLMIEKDFPPKKLQGMASTFACVFIPVACAVGLALGHPDVGFGLLCSGVSVTFMLLGGLCMQRLSDSSLKLGIGVLLIVVGLALGARTGVQLSEV
eukprot:CAMPEP_0181429472 /NCGR_PEP_ID=MMETSP1110-20121109/17218_1 /TAXON_ID=174948 /ORGANISM="Symbiodinium sp., Strain CCMP421" /LENGTH=324 /DNA_ID=CAMNT_0023552743 /DNA_START=57 /DNA_END=1031 /DNA_ORIENTATION=+